jgi:hypothetical protein
MIISHFSSVSVTTRVSTNLLMSKPPSWLWTTPAPSKMLNKADTTLIRVEAYRSDKDGTYLKVLRITSIGISAQFLGYATESNHA